LYSRTREGLLLPSGFAYVPSWILPFGTT
jgi:hypothetical protein